MNSYKIPNIAVLGVIAIFWLLQACSVGPNFQKTDPRTISTYRFDSLKAAATDTTSALKWWELFDDPVLDSLIITALEENKDVLIAARRIEEARANLGFNKADYYPVFGYQVNGSRGNTFGQGITTEDPTNFYGVFGSVNWEIDFWGKFRRANEAARAELAASEYGRRNIQISLISNVAATYFLLLDFNWRLEISQSTLESRREALDIIEARYAEGIIPEIDVNQAQIQEAIARAAVPLYQRQIGFTENALSILLGRDPGPISTPTSLENTTIPVDIPPGLPSELVERRPDILESVEIAHAQTARIGVAEALRFPSISLTGLFGAASTDLSTLTSGGPAWSAGVNLLGPLFNFGKNKRRVEVARAQAEQAVINYEFVVINAFREVEDALIEISTLEEEIIARRDYVIAANNARLLSRERYDKGITSYLEVLETERRAFEGELFFSEAKQNLMNGYVNLYKALGGGWLSPEEYINSQTGN